jgi:hypothetical protein
MKYQLRISIKPIDAIIRPHEQRDKDQVTDRSLSVSEYYRAVAAAKRKQKVEHALMHIGRSRLK